MDSGLAAFFTRQPSADALGAGNMGGAFFEGFIVTEAVKCFFNHGKKPDLFFWRSHDGLEVDLLIQVGGKIYPVEIKRTGTPKPVFTEPLLRFKSLAGENCETGDGILVCQTVNPALLPGGTRALPWQDFYPWLDQLLSAS